MEKLIYQLSDKSDFQEKVLAYFSEVKNLVFINRNDQTENFIAVSTTDKVRENDWKFGFISYDYKNKIEELTSSNLDYTFFTDRHFFSPEILFKIFKTQVEVYYTEAHTKKDIEQLYQAISRVEKLEEKAGFVQIKPRISKETYLEKVKALKQHIQLGDIYEINFCQEFYAEHVAINPIDLYLKLNKISTTPFSCFVKHNDNYLLCASPERYIKKEANIILSQPIKGTIKRGDSVEEDTALIDQLRKDPKEKSENVMIVDLVRNDLAKIAVKGSVNVDELCEIYTFPQVHQMVSTVSAELKSEVSFDDIIQATFPMGSMTGAPKVRAMKLIEEYEETKRGIYSGTVGFADDQFDFDFNVVIRSITYNNKNKYLSYCVGGAITSQSEPEKEYEECLLKAKAIMAVLGN